MSEYIPFTRESSDDDRAFLNRKLAEQNYVPDTNPNSFERLSECLHVVHSNINPFNMKGMSHAG